jgi:protoheme IX farnesyltransferase
MGNAITASAGFILASHDHLKGHINGWLFLATLVGLSCIIASGCIFNNYIDRHADKKMARTKNRPLAKGDISLQRAIIFASLLGFIGIVVLSLYTNLLTTLVAAFGFFVYVVLYSKWKYRSVYATELGSIAGAIPPVVGYFAVKNYLDSGAVILFMIVVLWQMPHFYAIAMYRFKEYAAASIPVLPVKKGMHTTKLHMLLYVIAFTLAAPMLTLFGYAGYAYLIVAAFLGLTWLWLCIRGFKTDNNELWARQMFRYSLVVITVLCIALSIEPLA